MPATLVLPAHATTPVSVLVMVTVAASLRALGKATLPEITAVTPWLQAKELKASARIKPLVNLTLIVNYKESPTLIADANMSLLPVLLRRWLGLPSAGSACETIETRVLVAPERQR